ncbi:MAG: SLATT domain-containing protein [Actinobacteria bacterium]|nr:SLATT domain-containing protein [Actinomycetota bacterium]
MAAEFQDKKSFYVKIINIIVVSLVLIILFFQAFNSGKIWISYIGACITISEVIFLIVQLTFNFEKRMDLHKKAALKFMALRDSYIFLITDIMNESINSEVIII